MIVLKLETALAIIVMLSNNVASGVVPSIAIANFRGQGFLGLERLKVKKERVNVHKFF